MWVFGAILSKNYPLETCCFVSVMVCELKVLHTIVPPAGGSCIACHFFHIVRKYISAKKAPKGFFFVHLINGIIVFVYGTSHGNQIFIVDVVTLLLSTFTHAF